MSQINWLSQPLLCFQRHFYDIFLKGQHTACPSARQSCLPGTEQQRPAAFGLPIPTLHLTSSCCGVSMCFWFSETSWHALKVQVSCIWDSVTAHSHRYPFTWGWNLGADFFFLPRIVQLVHQWHQRTQLWPQKQGSWKPLKCTYFCLACSVGRSGMWFLSQGQEHPVLAGHRLSQAL